jgi:hypothetical protein
VPQHLTRLQKLWRGELPLANAFWMWAVLGGLIINAITAALFLILIVAEHPVAALIAGHAPSLPYNVLVVVGVWRSAASYPGDPRWAHLARLVTIVGMIVLSVL